MKKYGRYEVKKKLGGGGMGVVFLAYDPRLGREVAIKVIGGFVSDKNQSRQRFNREAQVMAGLNHAAIVPIHDFGEQDGQPYLVMRLMRGGSLGDLLHKKGRFTLAEATQLLQRLAPALDMAHARGMVHRDLKPDNILLDQFGHPAITDFGLVKLLNASMPTKSGRVMGTPYCMSPEQGRGESDVDHKTDIYALGIILFKLLTNEWPYESGDPFGFIYLHNFQAIPNICDLNPDLPPECQTVIECALAKEREARYDSVRKFVEALKALQAPKRPAPKQMAQAMQKSVIEKRPITKKQVAIPAPVPASVPQQAEPARKGLALLIVILLFTLGMGSAYFYGALVHDEYSTNEAVSVQPTAEPTHTQVPTHTTVPGQPTNTPPPTFTPPPELAFDPNLIRTAGTSTPISIVPPAPTQVMSTARPAPTLTPIPPTLIPTFAGYTIAPQPISPSNGEQQKSETLAFEWEWNGGALRSIDKFVLMGIRDGQVLQLARVDGSQRRTEINMWEFGHFETTWRWYIQIEDQDGTILPNTGSREADFSISLSSN